MKAQDLRNSILQLAIQGKLVPQNPNDEPADVLYAKIQAEKQKLIKKGKIKKDKPLPSISEDEIPFEIPLSWKWVRLAELGIINPRNNINDELEVTFLPMDCLYSQYGAYPNTQNVRKWKELKSGYTHIKEGDVVIAKITPCFENGKSAVLEKLKNGYGAGTTELHVFRAVSDICLKYILIYLKSPFFMKYATKNMTGTAGQKRVPVNVFSEHYLPLPPLEEQKRIVAKIEELEPYVREYDKIENELSELNNKFPEQLRKSVLQYAVQGKLVPQNSNDEPAEILYKKIKAKKEKLIKEGKIKRGKDLSPIKTDEIPFKIPATWKWVKLNDISMYLQRGKSPIYTDDSNYKVVSQKCVQWSGFDITKARCITDLFAEKLDSVRFLRNGDILWNSTGLGTVGRVCLFDYKEEKVIADSHITVVRVVDSINEVYVCKYIASPFVQNTIEHITTGSTKQQELNLSIVANYLIPLPPLEEQCRIVAKVDELLEYCNKLESVEKYIIEKSVEPINNEWLIDKSNELYEQDGWVNPDRILDELGIVTILDRSLNKGRIEYVNNQFRICLRDRNDNWTKVHELVHYANDNAEIKLYGAVGRKDETSLSKSKEVNTDAITAEILMPENAVINFLKQENIKLNGLVVDKAIRKMAKQFKVSDVAVRIRLQNMNYKTK